MPPSPPGDLDATGKKLYKDLRAAMQERPEGPTQWEAPDHHLLSQACRYDMRARRARDGFAKSAGEMVTVGDRKQLTVHPLVKIAEQSERLFVGVLADLGFSPRARKQLEIEKRSEGDSKFGGFG